MQNFGDSTYNAIRLWNRRSIGKESAVFKNYLRELCSMDMFLLHDIEKLAQEQEVYVFSGIIRDFFLEIPNHEILQGKKKKRSPRDLDFVLDGDCKADMFTAGNVHVNQYGGLKLEWGNVTVDVWSLEETWGIIEDGKPVTPQSLLETSFFNFSAIVYDYNKEKFIIGRPFLDFLNTNILDVVYEKNPKPDLCIVNTLYYKEKLKCIIGQRLSQWIINQYESNPMMEYDTVQQRHFGKILYDKKKISQFVENLKK